MIILPKSFELLGSYRRERERERETCPGFRGIREKKG